MANTKKKTAGKAPPNTQDIQHQDLPLELGPHPIKQEIKVLPIEEEIALEVAKLPDSTVIDELKAKYGALTVGGVADKEGYEAAKKAWGVVRGTRTGFEKMKDDLKRRYLVIGKALDAREKELVDAIKPLEERLQLAWKAIDTEKQRLEDEQKQREEDLLQERLGTLTNAGMKFTDGYYAIGDTVSIDVATLRVMTEPAFQKLLSAVSAKADELNKETLRKQREEQDRKDAETRDKQAAQDAIRSARTMVMEALGFERPDGATFFRLGQDEADFTLSDHQVFDVDQATFAGTLEAAKRYIKQIADDHRTAQERKVKKLRAEARTHALQQAGLTYRAGDFVYSDGFNRELKVFGEDLWTLEDDVFSDKVKELSDHVGSLRSLYNAHQDEQKRLQAEKDLRAERIAKLMEAAGYRYDYPSKSFQFKNRMLESKWDMAVLLEQPDEEVEITAKNAADRIADAKRRLVEKEKEEADELEAQRQAQLGDDEVFDEYLVKLLLVDPPVLDGYKAKKNRARQIAFRDRLATLVNEFRPIKKEVVS